MNPYDLLQFEDDAIDHIIARDGRILATRIA